MAGGSGDGGTTPQEKSSSSPALLGLAGDVGTEGTLDQTSTDESSQQTVPPDMDSAQPTIKLNMDAHLGGPLPSGAIAGPPKRSTPALSVLPPSLPNSTAPTLRMPGLGVIPKGVAPNIVAMESRFVAFPPSEIASIIQAALGTERQTPDGDGPLDPPIDVKKLPDEFHLLLIDIRASDVFAKGHCLFSVNVTIPSTLLRRTSFGLEKLLQMLTSDQDRKMFSGITDKTHVVVVDASSERLSGDSPGGLLLQKLAKEANKAKLGWIQGGFAAFSKQHSDLVTAIQPANDPSPQGRRAPTHLPSIVGSGAASARHSPATPSGKSASKPVLTAPAGFFPPHGGPSSEYQTHVDAAPEVLKRMKIFAEETLPALPGRAPEFLKDLLGSGDVKGKISDRFQAIEAAEQKRFQASWRATSPNDPFSVSVGIERGYKNRFTNIWPYNANRVVLREPSQCDYINASFIDVPSKQKAYICAQGPIPSTFADFWLMVYETGARIVLMLTREEDNGRRQCHRYWPSDAENVMDLGPYLSVQMVSEERILPHLVARRLLLHRRHDPPEPVETRAILQLQYLDWPDHGVPEDARQVINFRELVDLLRVHVRRDAGGEVPVIVHCSAGCGRTGTFCTIDYTFDRLFRKRDRGSADESQRIMPAETTARPKAWYDEINLGKAAQPDSFPSPAEADGAGADSDLVFETVQNLRTQRLLMVQTYAQLAFCYEALVQRCLI